jgi:hypothetical protein
LPRSYLLDHDLAARAALALVGADVHAVVPCASPLAGEERVGQKSALRAGLPRAHVVRATGGEVEAGAPAEGEDPPVAVETPGLVGVGLYGELVALAQEGIPAPNPSPRREMNTGAVSDWAGQDVPNISMVQLRLRGGEDDEKDRG